MMYQWRERDGLVPCEVPEGPLLAADSWLVDSGAVRGLELHRRRFAAACAQLTGSTPATVDSFWAAVCASLPRTGRWFPRVELSGDPRGPRGPRDPRGPRLSLRIRPAPATSAVARLWLYDGSDPRRFPRCKGPDLAALAGLRARAADAGADDALLVDASGVLLEAAHAGVLWWEADTLCLPAAELPVLPSVTAALIKQRAAALGVPVRDVRRHPDDLDDSEVWLVNALHGIRAVTELVGCTASPGPAERASQWRRWLDAIAAPVP